MSTSPATTAITPDVINGIATSVATAAGPSRDLRLDALRVAAASAEAGEHEIRTLERAEVFLHWLHTGERRTFEGLEMDRRVADEVTRQVNAAARARCSAGDAPGSPDPEITIAQGMDGPPKICFGKGRALRLAQYRVGTSDFDALLAEARKIEEAAKDIGIGRFSDAARLLPRDASFDDIRKRARDLAEFDGVSLEPCSV